MRGADSDYVLGVGRDVSQRIEAEQARQQIEAFFRGIFEETPDCIIVADASRHVVMTNPSADRMFGYPPKGMVGQPVEALIPPEIRADFAAERLELIRNAGTHQVGRMWEFDAVRGDGINPGLLGMSGTVSEDAVRLGIGRIDELTLWKVALSEA